MAWCQQVKTVKPFDVFVAIRGIQIPGTPSNHTHKELVVGDVATDGSVMANIYRLVDGEPVFEQTAQFGPPNGLVQMIHLGLFVPQDFFYQFTDRRVSDVPHHPANQN